MRDRISLADQRQAPAQGLRAPPRPPKARGAAGVAGFSFGVLMALVARKAADRKVLKPCELAV